MLRAKASTLLSCAAVFFPTVFASAAGAQTNGSVREDLSAPNAEAQLAYDLAVATAEAQRKYDIAVAKAEAQRKFDIAKAQAHGTDGTTSVAPLELPTARGSEVAAGTSLRPGANTVRLNEIGETRCSANATSAEAIARDPNGYAKDCLNLETWSDYAVAGLNSTLSIGAASDVAEVLGTYSLYKRRPHGRKADTFSFTRWQFRGGPLVPVDKSGGTTAAFADLTQAQIFNRVGGLLGVEWRSGTTRTATTALTDVAKKMLVKAQRDCEAESTASILKLPDGKSDGAPSRKPEECVGIALQEWMAKTNPRANGYWNMVADDLWGKKPKAEVFFGVEGRFVPYQLKYVPFSDPALTGDTLLTGSPFVGTAIPDANMRKFDKPRYSVRMYGGGVDGNFGWGGSLTYRRIVDQPKGTKDVTLCPPAAAAATVCPSANIARPYESEGWVLGGRMAGKIPRFSFLPEAGIELRVSYASDLNQIGFDAPLYLLSDKDEKAQGGVRIGCTGDGKTTLGYVIKGECKASIFIGTNFTLRGAP